MAYEPAYWAGLFDGEGTVGAYQQKGYYLLNVSLTNTNIPILEELQRTFGGHIQSTGIKGLDRFGYFHEPCKRWRTTGQYTVPFLTAIHPHVVIKKEQVSLGLAFQQVKNREIKESLAKALKELK